MYSQSFKLAAERVPARAKFCAFRSGRCWGGLGLCRCGSWRLRGGGRSGRRLCRGRLLRRRFRLLRGGGFLRRGLFALRRNWLAKVYADGLRFSRPSRRGRRLCRHLRELTAGCSRGLSTIARRRDVNGYTRQQPLLAVMLKCEIELNLLGRCWKEAGEAQDLPVLQRWSRSKLGIEDHHGRKIDLTRAQSGKYLAQPCRAVRHLEARGSHLAKNAVVTGSIRLVERDDRIADHKYETHIVRNSRRCLGRLLSWHRRRKLSACGSQHRGDGCNRTKTDQSDSFDHGYSRSWFVREVLIPVKGDFKTKPCPPTGLSLGDCTQRLRKCRSDATRGPKRQARVPA